MPLTVRNVVLWLVALLVLGVANVSIWQKERLLTEGTVMLLQLAPRDPRALLQGDYMALRYALADTLALQPDLPAEGRWVVRLDANHVAHSVRLYREGPLGPDEHLLRYRKQGASARIGSAAFFFQEGQAAAYEQARYGELRVDKSGEGILVGLRDAELNPLGPRGDVPE